MLAYLALMKMTDVVYSIMVLAVTFFLLANCVGNRLMWDTD